MPYIPKIYKYMKHFIIATCFMGTGVMTTEGTWDAATKTLTQLGKCIDPSAGNAKEMAVRQVTKVIDDKNHVFEMYGPGPDGKEFKMIEIKMTKK